MNWKIDLLVCAALLLAAVPALAAQDADAAATPQTPEAAAAPQTGTGTTAKKPTEGVPLEAVFRNGFTLRTPDGRSELRVAASFHLDDRAYFGDSVAPDSFDIRRARIDVNAKMYDFMSLRIQAALEDNPYIRNAFLDLGRGGAVNLRIGQMKVPFSTQWLTLDNQVNFLERGAAEPVYPFFDRGLMLWGNTLRRTLSYQLGVFNGNGVDVEGVKGDIDDHKDVALRLFYQPFGDRKNSPLEGLYFVAEGTRALTSAATRRFETRGMTAANYESLLWRWRAEQTLGADGRSTDLITAEIDSRTRVGGEVHYLRGPLALSAEWLKTSYEGIVVNHDYLSGSALVRRDPVLARDGSIRSLSVWGSWFLTGERKLVDAFGWRQPAALSPFTGKGTGRGAWEVLARFSQNETDARLFDTLRVAGFAAEDLPSTVPTPVGTGNAVNASVLQGTTKAREMTVGVNWTMNYYFRVVVNFTTVKALDFQEGSRGIVSGGNSEITDPTVKNRLVEQEHMAGVRFIVRI